MLVFKIPQDSVGFIAAASKCCYDSHKKETQTHIREI